MTIDEQSEVEKSSIKEPELKSCMRARGLSILGTKPVLVARL